MDADDIMHPDRLKIQYNIMEEEPEITVSGSWIIVFGENRQSFLPSSLKAGGLSTEGRPSSACDYDTWLLNNGFEIITGNITPQAGDIVVFEAIEGHKHGHIAMYNGQQWISDFVQRDMYGGSDYRNNPDAKYTILRRK